MAYRLKIDEPVLRSVRRAAKEQFLAAERGITQASELDLAVHSVRKCIKRLRSLLWMVRPAMAGSSFKRENKRLRQIASSLSERRDVDVIRQTLRTLMAERSIAREMPKGGLEHFDEILDRRYKDFQSSLDAAKIAKAVRRARRKFAAVEMDLGSFDPVADGVAQTYSACQSAYGIGMVSPTEEHIHDLRKLVQRHWRHMQFLEPLWPGVFRARVILAREISSLLGSEHDTAIVMHFIEDNGIAVGRKKSLKPLLAACAEHQFDLRQRAFTRAEMLLASESRDWRRALPKYWRSAGRLQDESLETVGSAE